MRQEECRVKVSDVRVDYDYQRSLDESWVRRITREYDPARVNQIVLSKRDNGMYYVLDGNHTIEATRRAVGDDAELSAKVFYDLTPEEEAGMFYDYNKNRKTLTYGDKLKALVATGDEWANRYVSILDEMGVHWRYRGKSGGECVFTAHSGALDAFKKYGEDIFRKALRVFVATKDVSVYDGAFLLGYVVFIARANKEVDLSRIEAIVNRTPKDAIVRTAKVYSNAITGGTYTIGIAYARTFLDMYNKRLSEKNKIELGY